MNKKQNGFSLIELLIVIVIIGTIAAIAIPNLISSRRTANEASAISTLNVLKSSQLTFQTSMGRGNFATLQQLGNSGFIDSVIGCSGSNCIKSGYQITLNKFDTVPNISTSYFDIETVPTSFSTGWSGTGTRSFYTNEIGIIFYTISATAPSGTNVSIRRPTTGSEISN